MGADRFDGLLRVLSANPSRRGVGRVLAGLVLGASLDARFGLAGIEAKKGNGKGKKKKKKPCGPGNCTECCVGCCDGCCDDSGQCVPGTADDACESRGYPCDNCAEQGRVCREQSCGCDEQKCRDDHGCCLDSESCVAGKANDACGSDGTACRACIENHECQRRAANTYECCGLEGGFCGDRDETVLGGIVVTRSYFCCVSFRCNADEQTCEPKCSGQQTYCEDGKGGRCCDPPDTCVDGQCVGPCGPNGIVCGTPGPNGEPGTRRCCIGGEMCCQSAGVCYTPGKVNCSHTPGHHIKNVCPDDTGTCCYPPHPNNIGLLVCQYGPNCIDGYSSEPFFACPGG